MRTLQSEIEIETGPDEVWSQLMDFEAWKTWNPFVRSIEGVPEVGSRLRVVIQPPGSRATRFRPTVVRHEHGKRLEWLGSIGIRGILDGRHIFELEPLPDRSTRFVQREEFTGLAVGILWPLIRKAEAGFAEMNLALKLRSERRTVDS